MANSSLDSLVQSASAKYGVPDGWMNRVLNVEDASRNVNAVSPTGVQGLAQITHATWDTYNPGVPYSTDPAAQIDTQARILQTYNKAYGGNLALAAASYNGGKGVGDKAQKLLADNPGMSTSDAIAQAAASIYGSNPNKQKEINQYVTKVAGQTQASVQANVHADGQTQTTSYGTADDDAALAVQVSGQQYTNSQGTQLLAATQPSLVIQTGINAVPWYDDKDILQVNRPTRGVEDPVTFELYFDNTGPVIPKPIRLMASLRTMQKAMRHLMNHQQTRTGVLIDLWGMSPDTITGQCSTGMMMNQMGLTDYLSLAKVTDEVRAMVERAFDVVHQGQGTPPLAIVGEQGKIVTEPEGAFRVAARDAFVEFLSLFKNNGSVWYRNDDYTGVTTEAAQLAPNAWSPMTGSSTFQNASRRNDVLTRGRIVMNLRNITYSGYFKSLSWVMDAKSPFRWNFNFVFQVESTSVESVVPRP